MISCALDEKKAISAGCSSSSVKLLPVTVIRVPPACGPNSGHTSLSTAANHSPQHIIRTMISSPALVVLYTASQINGPNVFGDNYVTVKKLWSLLKPNSVMLSGSNQLRTSSEPTSVMEFGFPVHSMLARNIILQWVSARPSICQSHAEMAARITSSQHRVTEGQQFSEAKDCDENPLGSTPQPGQKVG